MPTTKPRYTITDTGPISTLLDDAQGRWPEVRDRKALLLRLAEAGHEALQLEQAGERGKERRRAQRDALLGLQRSVDWDSIRDDQAWR
ncbi:MAG TPA: hypothetical protein VGF95_14650 [Solirubrobacteraceae bacterium]|jgi:hypothetical protein